jgi:hypothetical protein
VKPNQLSEHLKVDRYGEFWLTDAIRPSTRQQIIPRQGYRLETFRDKAQGVEVPVLAAAVSREQLFEVFMELLTPLGDVVDVVLETSHDSQDARHRDLYRENIDLPVLESHLYDFEDLLLHDGCCGIAVMSAAQAVEVQFDEHKLLVVYANNLRPFERVVRGHDIRRDDRLRLITEGEHLHNSNSRYRDQFEQFCYRLGVGETVEQMSW